VNSLPKTVTRQRRDCDLYPGPSATESSTLTTRLLSHPTDCIVTMYSSRFDAATEMSLTPAKAIALRWMPPATRMFHGNAIAYTTTCDSWLVICCHMSSLSLFSVLFSAAVIVAAFCARKPVCLLASVIPINTAAYARLQIPFLTTPQRIKASQLRGHGHHPFAFEYSPGFLMPLPRNSSLNSTQQRITGAGV